MNNIPAFPTDSHEYNYQGMTLRDYFAAKAMQGIQSRVNWSVSAVAVIAYSQADALLEAREHGNS